MGDISSQFRLRNHMEDIVSYRLERMVSKLDMCKCEKCRFDIMAYALNLLNPKYVVTDKGDLYSRLSEFNTQSEVDVEVALTEAIKVVSQHPRH